jgi:hypothetical protein
VRPNGDGLGCLRTGEHLNGHRLAHAQPLMPGFY